MIPEKALKAAAAALEGHLPENFAGCAWSCGDDGDNADEHLALVALTAAWDQMLAHHQQTANLIAYAGVLHSMDIHDPKMHQDIQRRLGLEKE